MYDAEQFQIVAESDGPDAYNVIGRKYIIRKDISGKKYTICNIHGDEQAIIALNGGVKLQWRLLLV
ncbi:MAG: hypothetical protein IKN54_08470 [Lachnospiraceae bacterium]|nr:hypothetical protein [Lachnospiraceae bacterium]